MPGPVQVALASTISRPPSAESLAAAMSGLPSPFLVGRTSTVRTRRREASDQTLTMPLWSPDTRNWPLPSIESDVMRVVSSPDLFSVAITAPLATLQNLMAPSLCPVMYTAPSGVNALAVTNTGSFSRRSGSPAAVSHNSPRSGSARILPSAENNACSPAPGSAKLAVTATGGFSAAAATDASIISPESAAPNRRFSMVPPLCRGSIPRRSRWRACFPALADRGDRRCGGPGCRRCRR